MIRLAMRSSANIAIVPLQDVMNLGSAARMNVPAAASGNWTWRFAPHQLTDGMKAGLHELAELYGRLYVASDERKSSPHAA